MTLRVEFRAMASACEVQIAGDAGPRAHALASAAVDEVRRIEAKYSRYHDDSVTTAINRAAGGAAVAVDAETRALLDYADQCHRRSGGRFDLTSGVLRRAWDFRRTRPRVPSADEVNALLGLVGWTRVARDESTVRLPTPGMEIDFGGIGKEYAADRAAALLIEAGARHALVNLGGDVRVTGPLADGTPWRIGIRHPRTDGLLGEAELLDGALATSGDYERAFVVDGRRYCHLLDARTGWPVGAWQSVSVAAPLCVLAGTCATIAMLLGHEGQTFLREQGLRHLAVDADGQVHGDGALAASRA